jgi:hypothetical protein
VTRYYSGDPIKEGKMGWSCSTRARAYVRVCERKRAKTKAYGIFIGKCVMRPLGIPRLRWENNIKMDHERVTWEGVD